MHRILSQWVGIAQSAQWLATGWTVWGLDPGGGEIFCTHPDWSWGSPILLYDYQVLPWGG